MSGAILLNGEPDNNLIPEAAKRALHNLPVFERRGLAFDLIEYPTMGHVAIRCYLGQLAPLDVQERVKVFERLVLMQGILRSFGVSASIEKVEGLPPNYGE